jgi:hypothetical protein
MGRRDIWHVVNDYCGQVLACSWRGSFFLFYFFVPRQRRQKKSLMCGEWPARWEPQEEGVMSIAASFPSVKKPRFIVLGEERQTTEGDAC